MKLRHVHHLTFDKLICAISIICLAVVLVVVLVLKDIFQVLVLVLVLGGQVLVLVVVLGGSGPGGPCPCPGPWGSGPCPWWSGPCPGPGPRGQVLVNIPGEIHFWLRSCLFRSGVPNSFSSFSHSFIQEFIGLRRPFKKSTQRRPLPNNGDTDQS